MIPGPWLVQGAAWTIGIFPLALLLARGFSGGLTANPIEFLTHQTGTWSLILLCLTLVVTPLRRATGWNRLIGARRTLGLFAFFYASCHLFIYLFFDHLFNPVTVLDDVLKRPYITVGTLSFLLLLPLAITSTQGWIRRLGRRWQLLHRLIYPAVLLSVLHFYWKAASKADVREPLIFAAIVGVLFLARVPIWMARRRERVSRSL
jgi:sulfoxide reductase heme-binding subunit YedZ